MLTRKQKRDDKNRRHRKNEQRRELLRLLKRNPKFRQSLFMAAEAFQALKKWFSDPKVRSAR